MATAQVLPKELRLSAPPTMPRARSYLFKQQSTQSSYDFGNTIQINIPRLQRSYLTKDSYLKFAIKYVGTATKGTTNATTMYRYPIAFDTIGAAGIFDKIEIYDYLGSTLLESTAGHGQLLTLLNDISCESGEARTHYNISSGQFQLGAVVAPYYKYKTNTGTANTDKDCYDQNPTCGAPIVEEGSDAEITVCREYTIPLFSFLGLLSTKYAPLHNGYTINLTLNPQTVAVGQIDIEATLAYPQTLTGTIGAFTLTVQDVFLCAQVLELGGEAEALLQQSTGGQAYIVPTKAFRNYVGSMSEKITSYRLDLNLNVASLTNILWIMRPTTYTYASSRSLSDRIRNYLQSWYFQYGSSVLPQTSGIQCRSKNTTPQYGPSSTSSSLYDHSEAYNELLKSRHAYNQPNHSTLMNLNSFTIDALSTATTSAEPPVVPLCWSKTAQPCGKFAAGLDLELVSGRANDMVCGMNTNGMNTSIYANFDPTLAASVKAARVDAWCEYDAFINILPGVASTVSF